MKKLFYVCTGLWLMIAGNLNAQTLFVSALKGREGARGTVADPLSSLSQAVAIASEFTGNQPVTIKIYPGLYVLPQQAEIRTQKAGADTVRYTLEAAILPDHSDWMPDQMPVIQSVSPNNSVTQFTHCVGFLVAKNNVSFKGLKFLGNTHPQVQYYYPITRENEGYRGLEVSQCYFIGEKNSAPIQGAIWAHGAGTHVDHCVFYNCKNALLLFKSIKDFSLTHSIIYGAYEAAVWYGPYEPPFTFRNNVVSNCNYFWLRAEDTTPAYPFSHSLITGNQHDMGFYTPKGLVEAKKNSHTETGIRKSGKVILSEVKTEGLPKDYLHLTAQSDGADLKAGIFKK